MRQIEKITQKIAGQRPEVYALIYAALIPLFGILYRFSPLVVVDFGKHGKNIISCLYFSIITLSTLGYGDIFPQNKPAQILCSIQVIAGITLIGLFLNSISLTISNQISRREKAKESAKEKFHEKTRLINFNNLIELNIEFYIKHTIPITTPFSKRASDESILNPLFDFQDLCDLFKPSCYMTENLFVPAIAHYFKHQNNLEKSIVDLIYNVDLRYWPNLQAVCIEYLRTHKKLDFSDHILSQQQVMIGGRPATDVDSELISQHTGAIDFLPSNAINPYIALYHQIKYTLWFINNFRSTVQTIISDTP